MVVTDKPKINEDSNYNRQKELKAFADSKAGVKGLVDAGITKVPRMFIVPPNSTSSPTITEKTQFRIPVIDLKGITDDPLRHNETVEHVRHASETWDFFQVVNHGIPLSLLEEMKHGVRRFHELDVEEKKAYYAEIRTRNSGTRATSICSLLRLRIGEIHASVSWLLMVLSLKNCLLC
ncbi:1-aminocyclopropane-1-carboxylate oxidase-like protein [Hibiscus syriacus]|uniref:1-aminocyclopropane-1-carboxylate oxidase-like protein n=1 Tax=Hibiscus syriacus TaxID=106335 RepID=A0A6A3C9E4_HIBSY|nr:1-aminocyclopropane-1-carboxylate oxidase homolog [Hibiscus syriacus]KAE8723792.1 1-aminocyclopropane-1-carboxylate oxidase-like protein [Hibiscus syriacus]